MPFHAAGKKYGVGVILSIRLTDTLLSIRNYEKENQHLCVHLQRKMV